jgi:predicted nucleic acid-binding protein
MVALQIRDVPDDLRDRLSELARQRGQSLRAYRFDVIRDEARQDNLAVLNRFGHSAYRSRLSTCDAACVAAAGQYQCALVTTDMRLARASGVRCAVGVIS